MQIEFSYDEQDLGAFSKYYYAKGRGRRSLLLAIGAMTLVVVGQTAAQGFSTERLVSIGLIALVFGAIWWFLFRWLLKRSLSQNPQLREPRKMTIEQSGLQVEATSFSTDYQWEAFVEKVETSDVFLLFTSKLSALIIPKRVLTPEQLAEFRTFIK